MWQKEMEDKLEEKIGRVEQMEKINKQTKTQTTKHKQGMVNKRNFTR